MFLFRFSKPAFGLPHQNFMFEFIFQNFKIGILTISMKSDPFALIIISSYSFIRYLGLHLGASA